MAQDWFETFFRGPAVEFWNRAIPPEMTRTEADYLERALQLTSPARVLDVPCGNGRHSLELARRGYRVTGVDLSSEFLACAREESGALPVEWRESDVRDLPWTGEFDAAFCWGNSFGYLDRDGVGEFLAALHRALKPGGRFVADIPTASESLNLQLQTRRWHHLGDLYVLSEARYAAAAGRLDIDYTFIQGGAVETRPTTSYVFRAGELVRMFEDAGFVEPVLHGSSAGEPFTIGSQRLLLGVLRC